MAKTARRRAPRDRVPLGRNVIIFAVAAAAIAVLIAAAVGDRGYLEVRRRKAVQAALRLEVEQVRADNVVLLAEIEALKKNPYLIEKLAREKLGYARPGEIIYQFPPDTQSTQ